jgi:hypothetical protein
MRGDDLGRIEGAPLDRGGEELRDYKRLRGDHEAAAQREVLQETGSAAARRAPRRAPITADAFPPGRASTSRWISSWPPHRLDDRVRAAARRSPPARARRRPSRVGGGSKGSSRSRAPAARARRPPSRSTRRGARRAAPRSCAGAPRNAAGRDRSQHDDVAQVRPPRGTGTHVAVEGCRSGRRRLGRRPGSGMREAVRGSRRGRAALRAWPPAVRARRADTRCRRRAGGPYDVTRSRGSRGTARPRRARRDATATRSPLRSDCPRARTSSRRRHLVADREAVSRRPHAAGHRWSLAADGVRVTGARRRRCSARQCGGRERTRAGRSFGPW